MEVGGEIAANKKTEPEYYVWTFPGCPVEVQLDLKVVEGLQARIEQSGDAKDEQGVLFGRVLGRVTEISEFQSLADDEPDLAAVEGRLVGYYRIRKEGALGLNPSDSSRLQTVLSRPSNVALMIQAAVSGPARATFFFHEDGSINFDVFNEFCFDAASLSHTKELDAPCVPVSVEAHAAPPEAPPRKSESLPAAAQAEVNLSPAPGLQVEAPPAVQPPLMPAASPLPEPSAIGVPGFCAGVPERRNRMSNVGTWTIVAASVLLAGTLLPGRNSRALPAAAPVRSAETHAATLPADSTRAATTVSAPVSPVQSAPVVPAVSGARAARPREPVMQVASKPAVAAARPLPAAVPPGHLVKPFVPQPPQGRAQSAPAMFDPAPTATAGATPTIPVSLAIVNPQLPEGLKAPVPPAASIVAPSPEPKAQPRVQTPRNDEPAVRPAVVVTQVSPHFPPELKSVVISPKTVNVRVSIDESGRVLRATPLPKQNVHLFLINAAVRAAELSKFQPARKGDQAVASELVLQFTIRPGQ